MLRVDSESGLAPMSRETETAICDIARTCTKEDKKNLLGKRQRRRKRHSKVLVLLEPLLNISSITFDPLGLRSYGIDSLRETLLVS